MNIYKVWRYEFVGWDEACAMVIVAESEADARAMANANCKDEGRMWGDANRVKCEVVDSSASGVVLEDVNWG